MIAVALSGGIDSAAAAVLLHAQGERIMGVTMRLGDDLPKKEDITFAARLCTRLGIPYHMIDLRNEFFAIKDYFCAAYLASRTPNPCSICNRDMKFGELLHKAKALGADTLATGHYVKKGFSGDRVFLTRTGWKNSQEYFLGLITQDALKHACFPLGDMTRLQAEELVRSTGIDSQSRASSQDVCFIRGDYVAFIQKLTGFMPRPGPILDIQGRPIGTHRGAIAYTIGQRKGLSMGFGRRMYVLAVDVNKNTITIGDKSAWPRRGFSIRQVNFMRIPALDAPIKAKIRVRYKQEPIPATVHPIPEGLWVEFSGLVAPGQLAVIYDSTDSILCAGPIEHPL